jgi:hypothetical protein
MARGFATAVPSAKSAISGVPQSGKDCHLANFAVAEWQSLPRLRYGKVKKSSRVEDSSPAASKQRGGRNEHESSSLLPAPDRGRWLQRTTYQH